MTTPVPAGRSEGQQGEQQAVTELVRCAGLRIVPDSLKRLGGGNFTTVWSAETTAGPVVGRFWPRSKSGEAFRRETSVLAELGSSTIPTPEILWIDEPRQAVLMTAMPGTTTRNFKESDEVVDAAADLLVAVHSHIPRLALAAKDSGRIADRVNEWAGSNPDAHALHQVALRLEGCCASEPEVFVHGDFWTGNLLWDQTRITAAVDWERAGMGYRGQDVAKMRLDLAMLCGVDASDSFGTAYQQRAGISIPNGAYWDIRVAIDGYPDPGRWWLPTYRRLGYVHLKKSIIRTRFQSYIDAIAARGG